MLAKQSCAIYNLHCRSSKIVCRGDGCKIHLCCLVRVIWEYLTLLFPAFSLFPQPDEIGVSIVPPQDLLRDMHQIISHKIRAYSRNSSWCAGGCVFFAMVFAPVFAPHTPHAAMLDVRGRAQPWANTVRTVRSQALSGNGFPCAACVGDVGNPHVERLSGPSYMSATAYPARQICI
jgi:hypothetical protein